MCTNVGDFRCVKGTPSAVPPCDQTNPGLKEAGEELMRVLESAFIAQDVISPVKDRVDTLERRIAALEKEKKSVVQQIAALQESLEGSCPQGIKTPPSKEGRFILAAPIRGVGEDGRLILGDRRILSADALKI